jgi:hypothetical protein
MQPADACHYANKVYDAAKYGTCWALRKLKVLRTRISQETARSPFSVLLFLATTVYVRFSCLQWTEMRKSNFYANRAWVVADKAYSDRAVQR